MAIILDTLLLLSVIFAPLVVLILNVPPWKVVTVILLVRFVDATLAPVTTWYFSVFSSIVCGIAARFARFSSVNNDEKAVLVGANTVKGEFAVPLRVPTKFGISFLVSAETRELNCGFAVACVTIVGNPITAFTLWITPLFTSISVATTEETPLILTPLLVLINMLSGRVEEAGPMASVETYPVDIPELFTSVPNT